ncbi:MAG TPA: hypothetical protein VK832_20935 [Burkholderiaceae bacterium]|jgi:hypothetical protein|nr:hypothetical protein [Burkholderiaceae bacterium]
MSGISINPFSTTNQAGSFSVQSDGYIQGMCMSKPSIRNELAGGNIAATETLPMWGGVAIFENINSNQGVGQQNTLGSNIGRALTNSAIAGFSVFDQSTSWVNTPQSPVSLGSSGQTSSFYRLGSGANIPLAIDPTFAASLSGGATNQQVSWDFNNQRIVPYDASTPTISVTSLTATTVGLVANIAVVAAAATNVQGIGDSINISGAVNGGTGGNALINGNFIVTAFTDNEHFSYQVPVSGAGVVGAITGTILLNQGVGALAVNILDVQVGNSMIVVYNPVTGFATWNKQGACALCKI